MNVPSHIPKKQDAIHIPSLLEDEKMLLEYERVFQSLADSCPQLMWMAKADGWIYWYNRHWYRFTGSQEPDMHGWGWQSLHHPDMLPKVLTRWRSSLDTQEPFEMTFPLRGADGEYRSFLTRVIPVKDAQGQILRWFGTNTDVTEQIEAEKALRRSEKQLNDFFDTATLGLHWVGADGTILRANQAELDLLGYTAEEYIGRPIAEFHVDAPIIEDILSRLCNNEKLINYQARLRCKDGSIKTVLINSSVYWEDGQFIHTRCFTRDITERRLAEDALKKSLQREQLIRRVVELANQGLELEKILHVLAQEIGDFFQADRAFIIHLEQSARKFHLGAYAQYCRSNKIRPYDPTGMSPRLQELYQRNQSLESMMIVARVSSPEEYYHYCRDYLKERDVSESEQDIYCREMVSLNFEREGMRALLRLPVSYRGIPYGNIVLHQCQGNRVWSDEEVTTLQEIAIQVGIVFYQTQIAQAEKQAKAELQKSYEREHLIRKIVEVIGQSFEIDSILWTIADELGKNVGADRCHVSRFYFEDDKLIFCASGQYCALGIRAVEQGDIELITKALQHLTPKDVRTDQEQVANISDPEAYIAFLRQQMAPYHLPGLSTDQLIEMVRKYEAKSTLRVLIRYRNIPYGSITLTQVSHNREWLPEEIELVKIIAEHAGSAIYQAGLYREAQETALKEQSARQELERYAKRLEASNNELEQFATIASHDLSEPLRKIQMFADVLKSKVQEDGKDYLDRMSSAACRMQVLMDDLLTLSRINRKGQPFKPVDLNEIVKTVLEDLQMMLQESRATVSLENLGTVQGDETQMRQLFQNLIGNAVKYSRVETSPVVKIYGRPKGDHYETVIQDNGIGIKQEHTTRIFEPFQRLHGTEKYPGTGMGLAIVKKIVERHHGILTVESEFGSGSKFSVTLPMK